MCKGQEAAGLGVVVGDCNGEVIAAMVDQVPYLMDVDWFCHAPLFITRSITSFIYLIPFQR